MNIIMSSPVIIKILISLTVILAADRLIKNLALSMAIGTLVLALWSGHAPLSVLSITIDTMLTPDYIILLIMLFLLIWLSSQMKETMMMDDLVKGLQMRLTGKSLLAVVPAIIGLIPMPGGALFSAPLVDDCDTDKSMDPYLKTKINYWFRHMWEYWLPLYAGVILALQITGLEIWQIAIVNFPLTIFSAAGGYIFLLRKVKSNGQALTGKKPPVLIYLLPIILIVVLYTVIGLTLPGLKEKSKYLPMGISIFLTIVYIQFYRPLTAKKWVKIIFSKSILDMVVVVAVISIYGAFIRAQLPDGRFLMDIMRDELTASGISPVLLIILLPFISGFATGIAVGFVGASFPIIISILGQEPLLKDLLSAVVLAYASGHIGQLLSPVHVCNIVSNKYFKTDLLKSTAQLIPLCLFVFAGAAFSISMIHLIL